MAVSEPTKRIVWIRAGGRCVLCKAGVLEESISPKCIADVAHAAGHGEGPGTPRPVPAMTQEQRDHPDNLLLLCLTCHRMADDEDIENVYDLETLYEFKREHEKLVRQLLALMESSRTLVVRMVGHVRGSEVSATRLEVAAATAARGRVPAYLDDRAYDEYEIDLRGVDEDEPTYWDVQHRKVEKKTRKALDAIRAGIADHLTVFAFARIPLLILLGWLLDDTIRTDIAQRSRSKQAWQPVHGPVPTFQTDIVDGLDKPEALVVLQLSGTPDLGGLPDGLADLTRATISPVGSTSDVYVADTLATQDAFDRELRRALGMLEDRLVEPARLHVVAAAPLSLAVAFGRAIDPQVFPAVHVYDLHGSDYRHVLTLDRQDKDPA